MLAPRSSRCSGTPGPCEELEGRRFEWGRTVTGWGDILRFLKEVAGLYEPRDVDCSA